MLVNNTSLREKEPCQMYSLLLVLSWSPYLPTNEGPDVYNIQLLHCVSISAE